jgi:hypothetical protein
MAGKDIRLLTSTLVFLNLQAQLTPDVGIAGRIEKTAVGCKLPQGCEPGHREVRAGKSLVMPNLDQAALKHRLDGRRQLRLSSLRAATPSAQKDALGGSRNVSMTLRHLAFEFRLG